MRAYIVKVNAVCSVEFKEKLKNLVRSVGPLTRLFLALVMRMGLKKVKHKTIFQIKSQLPNYPSTGQPRIDSIFARLRPHSLNADVTADHTSLSPYGRNFFHLTWGGKKTIFDFIREIFCEFTKIILIKLYFLNPH